MARPAKKYKDKNEKRRAYYYRKKEQGFRQVCIIVSEEFYIFIKEHPEKLIDAFIARHAGNFKIFDNIRKISGDKVVLSNEEGTVYVVRHPDKIKRLKKEKGEIGKSKIVKLYPNGNIEITKG